MLRITFPGFRCNVFFDSLQEMRQGTVRDMYGCDLNIPFLADDGYFNSLVAVLKTIKIPFESRFAPDFQADGNGHIRLGVNPAILFVLPTNLLQLLAHGCSVSGALTGREREVSSTTRSAPASGLGCSPLCFWRSSSTASIG